MLSSLRSILLLMVLLSQVGFSGAAGAQDMEVFNLSDFVDPRLLEPQEEGGKPLSFFMMRFDLGLIGTEYQSRAGFTNFSPGFGQISANLYSRNWQIGMSALWLDTDVGHRFVGSEEVGLEGSRYAIRVGRYFRSTFVRKYEENGLEVEEKEEFFNRLQVSLESDEEIGGERTEGLGLHWHWAIGGEPGVVSSWNYNWLRAREVDGLRDRHYLSVVSRMTLRRWDNGAKTLVGLGVGGEQTEGHTKFSSIRLELAFEIPKFRGIRLIYAPAYRSKNRDHDSGFNHEITFMITGAWAKIF